MWQPMGVQTVIHCLIWLDTAVDCEVFLKDAVFNFHTVSGTKRNWFIWLYKKNWHNQRHELEMQLPVWPVKLELLFSLGSLVAQKLHTAPLNAPMPWACTVCVCRMLLMCLCVDSCQWPNDASQWAHVRELRKWLDSHAGIAQSATLQPD